MRRIGPLFSILAIALVVSTTQAGVPSFSADDIARLYASSREAIVVVMNERNDTIEKIQKDSEFRKQSLRGSTKAWSDLAMTKSLAHFFTTNTFGEPIVWSSGAGFFIREDGMVVTSYHIVKNSKNLFVILSSGERLAAEVIGFDARPDYDIAVLKVAAQRTFPVLRLAAGNSLEIGMPLLIIGHPYSFRYTANRAAISNLKIDASPRFIQIHSSVLPGNSGSPLINSEGFVVGVVYAAMIDSDTQGFAVPAWMIREVLDQVLGEAN